jgi:hypothetical protein
LYAYASSPHLISSYPHSLVHTRSIAAGSSAVNEPVDSKETKTKNKNKERGKLKLKRI